MGRAALGQVSVRFRAIGVALFWGSAALAQVPGPPAAQPVQPSPVAVTPVAPLALPAKETPEEFLLRASPWVDFTLTSFWQDQRFSNFLNLGVQVGGYFFERLRLSARLIAPLESVTDEYSRYNNAFTEAQSNGTTLRRNSRAISALYSVSAGLVISTSRSFVFGPSLVFQRADVSAYGSAVSLALPFEWTTRKSLRAGFELSVGHAFGGSINYQCYTIATPAMACPTKSLDRPSGTAFLIQYNMGWSLGAL